MPKLKEYHFSCGNSSRNTVGFCATVKAHSKAEAVTILQILHAGTVRDEQAICCDCNEVYNIADLSAPPKPVMV